MSELLPSDSDAAPEQDGELQTLWLDSDEAGDLLSSLASDTARNVLTTLHEEPATASEVADAVDTSLQNARHHLDNLQEAGLVRIADTRYSSKGREMNVYAPSRDPTVVFVGNEESGLVDSLKELVPAVAVLAAVSLLVQWFVTLETGSGGSIAELPRLGQDVGTGAAPLGLPPGLLVFAGGLVVLGAVLAVQAWRDRRPTPT